MLLVLTIVAQSLFSQNNKFGLTIEYSPNYSRLSDEILNEKFKLSHNVLLRLNYKSDSNIKPTLGLGYFNTGELNQTVIGGTLGIESIKYFHNYNYVYLPLGAKINLGNLYLLPEIGIGINLSNKMKRVIEFTNGKTENETIDEHLNSGEFNKLSIPISISAGTDFKFGTKRFSTGLKGYYGLNRVVEDVPRNNHYYGIGLLVAMNL
ncbi:MAG: outer membrane beta-barrel protein [Bacteroidia bacterium]|nr:outer membrane beta-barrel protein [Bacteroidia bacterium]